MTEAAAWRLVTRGGLFVVALVAAVWLIIELQSLIFQVFLALIMASAADPIVGRVSTMLQCRIGQRRVGRGPVVLTIFALGGFVALVVTLKIASVVLGELAAFSAVVDQESAALEQQVSAVATQLGIPPEIVTGFIQQLQGGLDWLAQLIRALLSVFGSFLSVVFTVIIAIYLASDADRILSSIVSWLPRDNRPKIDRTLRLTGKRLGRWVLAQLVVATIVSSLWAVGLTILGIPYVGLLSLIAFLGEFVPLVGPFISSIPTIFVAFATTTPAQGIATMLFCLIVEQIENDWLVPRVMSSATTVHPLAVLLGILAGGQLFGPIGALLAVPFATCVSVFLGSYRAEESGASDVTWQKDRDAVPDESAD
jgi:predicted PurR-regulated permease PerM